MILFFSPLSYLICWYGVIFSRSSMQRRPPYTSISPLMFPAMHEKTLTNKRGNRQRMINDHPGDCKSLLVAQKAVCARDGPTVPKTVNRWHGLCWVTPALAMKVTPFWKGLSMIQVTIEETMWLLHFSYHFGCLQNKFSSSYNRILLSTRPTFTIHYMCRYRAAWVAILYFKSLRKLPELSLTRFLSSSVCLFTELISNSLQKL